ncbi:unnamed protein product, partial [Dicrocoelium dendriticum]
MHSRDIIPFCVFVIANTPPLSDFYTINFCSRQREARLCRHGHVIIIKCEQNVQEYNMLVITVNVCIAVCNCTY